MRKAGEAGPRWKGQPMWVFDGEEWTDEGATSGKAKPEVTAIPFDKFLPELQVIEIVQIPKQDPMPPFPMP